MKQKVIVHFTKSAGAYNPGDFAGFQPDRAKHLVEIAKVAVYRDRPPADVAPKVVSVETDGDPFTLPEDIDTSIDVPDDWRDAHHATRIGLATRIMKRKVESDDEAVTVLDAYTKREEN